MNNNEENKQNVNVNEQLSAQVENNEKKSWIGTGWQMIKNTGGIAANFVKEHKVGTAAGMAAMVIATVTLTLVVLKKKGKGKAGEAAVNNDGFDNIK